MSEHAHHPSPVDQYYAGQEITLPLRHPTDASLLVKLQMPSKEAVSEQIAAAEWHVLEDPESGMQFQALVFNGAAGTGRAHLQTTTAGQYRHPHHMFEGAVEASQYPEQPLVLLPSFSLVTKKELGHYATTGMFTHDGKLLPSITALAGALSSAKINGHTLHIASLYGRSAGTEDAAVLASLLPELRGVVLGALPQLTRRSPLEYLLGALEENKRTRLEHSGHTAEDSFQVKPEEGWQAEILKRAPERPPQTGQLASSIGNIAVRGAHWLALAQGIEPYLHNLEGLKNRSGINVGMVVYEEDRLYGQTFEVGLVRITQQLSHLRLQILTLQGGHRLPERYPLLTNDITASMLPATSS